MTMISQNINVTGADAYDDHVANDNLTVASGVTVKTDTSHIGIALYGAGITVTNNGGITGGSGIAGNSSATVINNGTITGTGGYNDFAAIAVGENSTVINNDTLSGTLQVDSGSTVTNSGTINGHGLNAILQTIDPASNTFILSVHNTGTINGNVFLGGTYDGAGGTINGNLTGGHFTNDTFELSHQTITGTVYGGGGGEDKLSFDTASGGMTVNLAGASPCGRIYLSRKLPIPKLDLF